jgi:hypothetical protein
VNACCTKNRIARVFRVGCCHGMQMVADSLVYQPNTQRLCHGHMALKVPRLENPMLNILSHESDFWNKCPCKRRLIMQCYNDDDYDFFDADPGGFGFGTTMQLRLWAFFPVFALTFLAAILDLFTSSTFSQSTLRRCRHWQYRQPRLLHDSSSAPPLPEGSFPKQNNWRTFLPWLAPLKI